MNAPTSPATAPAPAAESIPVDSVRARAYTFPTPAGPESDGTLQWDSTTAIVVEAAAGGEVGLGYTYGPSAVATFVDHELSPLVEGTDPHLPRRTWVRLVAAVRNAGRPGVAAGAVSAVDIALWDLHARLLGRPLSELLGRIHDAVPVYGSGGFCNEGPTELANHMADWVGRGIPRVKVKVGRHPSDDPARLTAARRAIGDDCELFVDANGAFGAKEALGWARRYAEAHDVRWFEEPVSSDDLDGLALVRRDGPPGMDVAAGEYGYHLPYFHHLLDAGAVDCLQADVTRCGGYTAFLEVAALAAARSLDLSAHCAPQASAHVCTAVRRLRHLEYFRDHVRIEPLLFDGVLEPVDGCLRPDPARPGHGLSLKRADAERWAA